MVASVALAVFTGCQTSGPDTTFEPYSGGTSSSVATPPGVRTEAPAFEPPPVASNSIPALANAIQGLTNAISNSNTNTSSSIVLREGDVVKITFPTAPNLNILQPIRRDGKITLQMGGEITAAGKTPKELEAEVLRAYDQVLLTKEVTVSVEASTYPVFVTGAVVRPGKILLDRPATVLEAIMEAGGFDYAKANLKKVRLIRRENGMLKTYYFDLKSALAGRPVESFYVMPSDIVYVPEKFQWF